MKILPIKTESKHYNIYIGHNIFNKLNNIIKRENISFKKSLLIADRNVPRAFIKKINSKINAKKKIIYILIT